MSVYKKRAIEALRRKEEFLEKMRRGIPWGVVKGYIADELPKAIEEQERGEIAYNLVPRDT